MRNFKSSLVKRKKDNWLALVLVMKQTDPLGHPIVFLNSAPSENPPPMVDFDEYVIDVAQAPRLDGAQAPLRRSTPT